MTETINNVFIDQIATELQLSKNQVKNTLQLLTEGNTVPFIARYRKELTNGLDEVALRAISESWEYARNLAARKKEVIRLIAEQEKLTPELQTAIERSSKIQEVEDLYRPYRQKRRTRATIAKEKGLEPLAEWLFSLPVEGEVETEATNYLSEEHEITSAEEALQGANDIIAEWVSDNADFRQWIRKTTYEKGKWQTTVKDEELDEKKTYEMYYDYEEKVPNIVPHRILAMNRGEKEGILRVKIVPPIEEIITYMQDNILIKNTIAEVYIKDAVEDSYKRLIEPSIERELRTELTEKAEEQAIHIFSENLKQLLLQPPLKGNVVLGIDPAYRTGCKLAVVSETGRVLAIDVIYPTVMIRDRKSVV